MSRLRLRAASAVLAIVALCAIPTAAVAHDQLLSSSPTAGDVLAVGPDTITLTFSAEILPAGTEVVVVDSDLTDWTADTAVVDGDTVTVDVRDGLTNGGYQVRWHVVSSDGHPISGAIPFTVGSGEPMPLPGTEQAPPAGSMTSDTASAAPAQENTIVRTAIVGGAGAIVAVAAALLISVLRRRSRRDATASDTDSPTSSKDIS